MAESRVEDLLETGVEQPVLPMSEIEAILRGEPVTPHSRIAELLLKYNPSDILIEKRITENGTYFATNDNADGYYKVVVDEYVPRLILKQVTANGTYDPSDDDADGYSSITVNVQPLLERVGINITENGMSSVRPSQGYDGLEAVALNVNVQPPLETKNIDDNGTYTPSSGMYGFSSVTVAVPKGSNANITLHCQGLGGGTVTITATNSGQTYTHTNSITTDDEDTTFNNLEYVGNWTVTNSKDSSTLTVNNSAVEADLKLLTPSIPKMISATLPKGEVSCSSSFDSGTYALFAVDKHMSDTGSQYYGNPNVGWLGNDGAPWIKYKFDEPVFFNKLYFRLHSRWDTSWATNRSYTWMVEGSNDDITYETVLANGDDTVTQYKSYNYWWIFDLALNGKKYKYLRLSTNHTMYSRDYWNENMLDLQLYSDPNAVEPITPADIALHCIGLSSETVTITSADNSEIHTSSTLATEDEDVVFSNLNYIGNWTVTTSADSNLNTTVSNASSTSKFEDASRIPIMTGVNTPCGICIASSTHGSSSPYMPFDGTDNWYNFDSPDAWTNQRNASDNTPWIGYHFEKPTKITKVWWKAKQTSWETQTSFTFYYEVSHDGTNWDTLGNDTIEFFVGETINQWVETTKNLNSDVAYEYFRIRANTDLNVHEHHWVWISRIQVYGDAAQIYAPSINIHCKGVSNGTVTIDNLHGVTYTQNVTTNDEHIVFDKLSYAGIWRVTNSIDSSVVYYVSNDVVNEAVLIPTAVIPTMTGVTTPEGECLSSSNNWGDGGIQYYPFDGNQSSVTNSSPDAWTNQRGDNSPWIGYHFASSHAINRVWVEGFCVVWDSSNTRTLYFEGSNDGSTWDLLHTENMTFPVNTMSNKYFDIPASGNKYSYFRIRFDASLNVVDSRWIFISRVQVYENPAHGLTTLTATANGTYDPTTDGYTGYSSVTVAVPNALKGLLERTVSVIDDSVLESIGNSAFYNYATSNGSPVNLTSVKFSRVRTVGIGAFAQCKNLITADFPELLAISNSCFYRDSALQSVNFPKVVDVETNAFDTCGSLTNIDLPEALKIDTYGFISCSSLETANLPKLTTLNGSGFGGCSALKSIDLPNVTSLGSGAFSNCTSLKSANIPKISSLSTNVFNGCTSLEMFDGNGITQIQQGAFSGASSLGTLILRSNSVVYLANIIAFTNTPFASGGTGGTLYVPQALISSYQSAGRWSTILGYPNNQIKPIEGSIYE